MDEPTPFRKVKRAPVVPTPETVMSTAVKLLTGRAMTRVELRTKLEAKKYPAAWIEEVLDNCARFRYFDDDRFAVEYADQLVRNGYGPRHIRMNMKKRGFSETLIRRECERLQPLESETIKELLELRKRQFLLESDPRKRRAKVMAFLERRGFSRYIAGTVVESVFACESSTMFEDAQDVENEGAPSRTARSPLRRNTVIKPKKTPPSDPMSLLEGRRKRLESESDPRKRREKAYRFLLSKGVPYDDIRDALETFFGRR